MTNGVLTRDETGDEGTFGTLVMDDGFTCRTLELPWRDNKPDISCIPVGTYECLWLPSVKFGEVYQLQNVLGRSAIEIHVGNWAGAPGEGLRSNLHGCIALGESIGQLWGQKALINSMEMVSKFEAQYSPGPIWLTIQSS